MEKKRTRAWWRNYMRQYRKRAYVRKRARIARRVYLARPEVAQRERKRMSLYLSQPTPNRKKRIRDCAYHGRSDIKIRRNKRNRERYETDLQFKLRIRVRTRTKEAMDGKYCPLPMSELLGCPIPEALMRLKHTIPQGMGMEDWGTHGLHLDHIRPLVSFDLSDPEQLRRASHISNLQMLPAKDNLRKGARA